MCVRVCNQIQELCVSVKILWNANVVHGSRILLSTLRTMKNFSLIRFFGDHNFWKKNSEKKCYFIQLVFVDGIENMKSMDERIEKYQIKENFFLGEKTFFASLRFRFSAVLLHRIGKCKRRRAKTRHNRTPYIQSSIARANDEKGMAENRWAT